MNLEHEHRGTWRASYHDGKLLETDQIWSFRANVVRRSKWERNHGTFPGSLDATLKRHAGGFAHLHSLSANHYFFFSYLKAATGSDGDWRHKNVSESQL